MQLRVPLVGLPVVWLRSGQLVPLAGASAALLLLASTAFLRQPAPRGRHALRGTNAWTRAAA
jgi:hypothetical protein